MLLATPLLVLLGAGLLATARQVEVEDVTARQLEAATQTEDVVAVYWYSKNCKTCDRVLGILERSGEEVAELGITLLRINDKKAAKAHGVRNFPALSVIRSGDIAHYESDLTNPESLMEFFTNSLADPADSQVRQVTASELELLVGDHQYVAVFFYDPDNIWGEAALNKLEEIDDDLDAAKILLVKVADVREGREFGVKSFPSIVMFVRKIPELFHGDVSDASEVLGWCLTQAGLNPTTEEANGSSFLPSASAASTASPPPVNKVAPKPGKKSPKEEVVVEPAVQAPAPEAPAEVATPPAEAAAEEPEENVTVEATATEEVEEDEVVSTIKNGNNVVAFFYSVWPALTRSREADTPSSDAKQSQEVNNLLQEANIYSVEAIQAADMAVSCWPLTCGAAKHVGSHAALNIGQLKAVPLVRAGSGGRRDRGTACGWLPWLFGYCTEEAGPAESAADQPLPGDDETTAADDDNDNDNEDAVPEEDDTVPLDDTDDKDKTADSAEVDDDEEEEEERPWYEIDLLGWHEDDNDDGDNEALSQSWLSVTLFSDDFYTTERPWYEVDLLGDLNDADDKAWYEVDLLGDDDDDNDDNDDDDKEWYTIDLLGSRDEGYVIVCKEINHDERAWYEVSFLGNCDDGVKDWYEIELLSVPGDEAEEEGNVDTFGLDLFVVGGEEEEGGGEARAWYELDLFNLDVSDVSAGPAEDNNRTEAHKEDKTEDSKAKKDAKAGDDLTVKKTSKAKEKTSKPAAEEDAGDTKDKEREDKSVGKEKAKKKASSAKKVEKEDDSDAMPGKEEEAVDKHAKGKSSTEKPAKEKATAGNSGKEKASADKPVEEKEIAEKSAEAKASEDKPGKEKAKAAKPEKEKAAAAKPEKEKAADAKPGKDDIAADKPAKEKSGADKPAKGKDSTEKPAKDKTSADKGKASDDKTDGSSATDSEKSAEDQPAVRKTFEKFFEKSVEKENAEKLALAKKKESAQQAAPKVEEKPKVKIEIGGKTQEAASSKAASSGSPPVDQASTPAQQPATKEETVEVKKEEKTVGKKDGKAATKSEGKKAVKKEDPKQDVKVAEKKDEKTAKQTQTPKAKAAAPPPAAAPAAAPPPAAAAPPPPPAAVPPTAAPPPSAADDDEVVDSASSLASLIGREPNVVVLLYENMDKISKKIMAGLDRVEGSFLGKDLTFLTVNIKEITDVSVSTVPSLIYFKNGDPFVYEDNLMNEDAIRSWVEEELKTNQDVIEDLTGDQIHELMVDNSFVMVYLYAPDCPACEEAIKQLEQIDDDTDAVGVKFVKTDDAEFAAEYGITEFPAILYFEDKDPSIYDGDAAEETELLTWMLYQMKEDTIENINRDLLNRMIDDYEFLAVFFYEDNADSAKVLRHLELIDDEAAQYGVRMVKISDPLMSKKYGHRTPPGLGFFRKGNYIKFDGDLFDDEEMLDWLTDPTTMEISDQIEKVNKKMFEKLIARNEFLTVFFYSESDCKQCSSVLQELEHIDDDAEVAGIPIVKLEDRQLAKTVGVFALPAIVFFRNFGEEATIYAGDMKREDSILEWLLVQKDPSNEAIEEMEGEELRTTIQESDAIAVFVYSREECEECLTILTELENIDDDVDRQKIAMVKTTDAEFAAEVGVETFPSLVFFKEGVPNLYEGDMTKEEEVLDWLIEMKVESHIELITRAMLETMVEEVQYLAVFFYKQNCRTCDQVIAELEKIDDECDMFGIQMVKLKDPQLAKRYGIKTFPALVYFRNGNPLTFDGDLKSEESVLEWLTDDDNRELEDEIEAVNFRMLDKLLESSSLIAVFFYDEECVECDAILEQLELIDDEADEFGINFVKNDDPHAARQYNIYNTPALVYFRKMVPIVYDGDLMDDERILEWLTSQDVFETKDEIEEVNRRMLEKLLDENEFVAVYFYEDNCAECDEVLSGLEKIDDETDALDITFVKVNDPRYAKKYGVNRLPALVYFRRKFPSIYRDSLLDEDAILEWITTNRYKQMELGLFMYAIIALAITFMFYTAFLMFGLKPKEVEKKKEE